MFKTSASLPAFVDFGKLGYFKPTAMTIESITIANEIRITLDGCFSTFDGCFSNKKDGSVIDDVVLNVDKIILNGPATIIFWKDGTKTVVKFHKEKGLENNSFEGIMWGIAKKIAGSRNQLHKHIAKSRVALDSSDKNIVFALLLGWLGKTPYELQELIYKLYDNKTFHYFKKK